MGAEAQNDQTVNAGLDFVLIFQMFKGDLDLCHQFARIGHYTAARQHLEAAQRKLTQLQMLPKTSQPVPEAPAIEI